MGPAQEMIRQKGKGTLTVDEELKLNQEQENEAKKKEAIRKEERKGQRKRKGKRGKKERMRKKEVERLQKEEETKALKMKLDSKSSSDTDDTNSSQENENTTNRMREKKEAKKREDLLWLNMFSNVIKLIKTYRQIRIEASNCMTTKKRFDGIKGGKAKFKSSHWLRFLLLEDKLEMSSRNFTGIGKGSQSKAHDEHAESSTKEPAFGTYEWPRRTLIPMTTTNFGRHWSTDLNLQQPVCLSSSLKCPSPLQQAEFLTSCLKPSSPPKQLPESNYLDKNYSHSEDGNDSQDKTFSPTPSESNDLDENDSQSEEGDDSHDKNYSPTHDDCQNINALIAPVESFYNLRRRVGDRTKFGDRAPPS